MEALWGDPDLNNQVEPKWRIMLIISLVLHLAAFSLIFFVPENIPTRRIRGTVYEVNLVQMPTRRPAVVEGSAKVKAGKPVISSKKTTPKPAKRISRPKKKEKAVVIAKRTVSTKKKEAKKPAVPPSKRIEKALRHVGVTQEVPCAPRQSERGHDHERQPRGSTHGTSFHGQPRLEPCHCDPVARQDTEWDRAECELHETVRIGPRKRVGIR